MTARCMSLQETAVSKYLSYDHISAFIRSHLSDRPYPYNSKLYKHPHSDVRLRCVERAIRVIRTKIKVRVFGKVPHGPIGFPCTNYIASAKQSTSLLEEAQIELVCPVRATIVRRSFYSAYSIHAYFDAAGYMFLLIARLIKRARRIVIKCPHGEP